MMLFENVLKSCTTLCTDLKIGCIALLFFLSTTSVFSQSMWVFSGDDSLVNTTGVLTVPQPLNPEDFVVANQYGSAQPDENGLFSIPVQRIGATVTAAVPMDYTEGDNAWVSIVCRFPQSQGNNSPLVEINADSTARSMIILHPFFLTPDPYKLEELQLIMDGLPALDDLTAQVTSSWPSDTTPLDDPNVMNDLQTLFDDVLDALPSFDSGNTKISTTSQSIVSNGYVYNKQSLLNESALKQAGTEKVVDRQSNPRIVSSQLDPIIQSSFEFDDANPAKVQVSSSLGNPLDTVHKFVQVDPLGTHSFRRSDSVISTFKIESREQAFAIRNKSGLNPELAFFASSGFQDIATGPSDGFFAYLDFVSLIASAITDAIGLGTGPSNESELPSINDDVYVDYVFTGKLTSGGDSGEFLYAWNNHKPEVISAFSLNLLNGALDALSVLVELDDVIGPCAGDIITGTIQDANAALNFPTEDAPSNVYEVVFGVGKTTVTNLSTCAINAAVEAPIKGLLSLSKSLLNSVNIIQKVSAVGSVVDRAVGLSGFPIGPSPTTLFTSPMDTRLIVIGDPWGPRILSVNGVNPESPSNPLDIIECGGTLTIRGKRLQAAGSSELPQVFVRDRLGNSIRLKIDDFNESADAETPPTQEIAGTLPEGVAEIIRIRISNEAGSFETPDILEIPPVLTTAESNLFFLPDGGSLIGETIVLKGKGFNPALHKVLIGSSLVVPEVDGSDTEMKVEAPADLPAGLHEIKIRWREPEDDISGSPEAQFARVLGPPTIDDPGDLEVIGTGSLTINGSNFGTLKTDTKVYTRPMGVSATGPVELIYNILDIGTIGNDQQSQMIHKVSAVYTDPLPDTPAPDPVMLEVLVETPAGFSDPVGFVLTGTGSTVYTRFMQVPEITFAEAISFANQGDTAPEGAIEVNWECVGMSFCGVDQDDNPIVVTDGACVVDYPASWGPPGIPGPFGSEPAPDGVSAPPGFPPAVGTPCNDCDVVGEACFPVKEGPITWEGIPASDIFDDIDLEPGAMDVSLSGLPILKGPSVFISQTTLPDARFIGGGFIIEGDGIDDPTPRNITLNIDVEEASGTVITIRDCHGVFLNLDIKSEGADVGVMIENCRNIVGRIRGSTMGRPVVIKDSFDCDLDVELTDYDTGVTIDGGGRNRITGNVGWRRGEMALEIEPMQGVGISLKGGTTQNVILADVVGNMTAGLMVEDSTFNTLSPAHVGVISFGELMIEDMDGTSARNAIGILLKDGADENRIDGAFYNNDVAIKFEGGENNIVGDSGFGVIDDPVFSNDIGILFQGSSLSQPTGNVVENCVFYNSFANSIIFDNATGSNRIVDNFFTSEGLISGKKSSSSKGVPPDPMEEPVQISIINASSNINIQENWFDQTIIAAKIENSTDISFNNNRFTRTQLIGIAAQNSHSLSFIGERICGSVNDPVSEICFAGFMTEIGMTFSGCSNLLFNDVRIEALGGDGMMFTDPPTEVRGLTRILSPDVGDGSGVIPPPRADGFAPLVEPPSERINGARAVLVANNLRKGIVIRDGASDISILGAKVNGNGEEGIFIDNPGPNISIEQSEVTFNKGNGVRLLDVAEQDVRIGTPKNGNQLSANDGFGVSIEDSSGPIIQSNFIVFNGQNSGNASGIIVTGSTDILIGGSGLNDSNLISGNDLAGIDIQDFPDLSPALPTYQIEGNFIGTTFEGTAPIANKGSGIALNGDGGNPDVNLRILNNLIAGNDASGIRVQEVGTSLGPVIQGNLIGLDSTAGVGASNGDSGVSLLDSASALIISNRVLGNTGSGLNLDNADFVNIAGNEIDGNSFNGVAVFNGSDDNTIQANKSIRSNGLDGVMVGDNSENNYISRNSITGNSDKGISLEAGGNNSVPSPTITGAGLTTGGRPVYTGIADPSLPNFSLVELFVDDGDEGETFLAATDLVLGRFSFFGIRVPAGVSLVGKKIKATVTDLDGNTSEFGAFDLSQGPRDPFFPPIEPNVLIGSTRDGAIVQTRTVTGTELSLTIGPDDSTAATNNLLSENEFLFTRLINGFPEIFSSNISGEFNLTNNPASDFHPSISNDRSRIAFVSDRSGMQAVYVANIDGSNPVQITSAASIQRHPDWSPDGTEIVYASNETGSLQLRTVNVAQGMGSSVPLTDLAGVNDHPTWNSMTGLIAFEHASGTIQTPGDFQIGIIDPDTSITTLFGNSTWSDEDPEWVIDTDAAKSWLLISSRDTDVVDSNYNVYFMTENGVLESRVTPEDSEDFDPACCFNDSMSKDVISSNF